MLHGCILVSDGPWPTHRQAFPVWYCKQADRILLLVREGLLVFSKRATATGCTARKRVPAQLLLLLVTNMCRRAMKGVRRRKGDGLSGWAASALTEVLLNRKLLGARLLARKLLTRRPLTRCLLTRSLLTTLLLLEALLTCCKADRA